MTQVTPDIMYKIGQIARCVYDIDMPSNVERTILRYPLKGLGLMQSRGDLNPNDETVARLIDKLPADLEDPKDKMPFDCQGAFWVGYYQYANLSDNVQHLGAEGLTKLGKALYGDQWQTNLARDLNLSDARRIRAWLTGERKIPMGIWADIADLLRERQLTIAQALQSLSS